MMPSRAFLRAGFATTRSRSGPMPAKLPGPESAQTLAQAIVDTIHEPLLVLDAGFNVVAASRSFSLEGMRVCIRARSERM